jgi:hypothetical protein
VNGEFVLTLIFSIPLFLGVKALEENGAEKANAREMKLPRSDGRSCSGFHFFPQLQPVQELQQTLLP